ncbi:MAG TPA: GNAT family N-acetyltransferase [Flavisolibacter sp.]|nr:GNAT family N-acetyltransferase [Flavisolibacter sp.]
MQIRTLENTSLAEITAVFNNAFQGYFVKLEFTEESMAAKIKSEGIRREFSIGAFDNNRLVGFILHGYDSVNEVKTVYNAGTGVIAAYRGQGITKALYQYAIPFLAEEGIRTHLLEVIDGNLPAMHIYEQIGFKKIRKLHAFKSQVPIQVRQTYAVEELRGIPSEAFIFPEMISAWQNSLSSVERAKEDHRLISVSENNLVIGFAAYVAANGRIKQLAVHPQYRRKGVGAALLQYIGQNSSAPQLVATNIDEAYEPCIQFLQALGFEKFLSLDEMKLVIREG